MRTVPDNSFGKMKRMDFSNVPAHLNRMMQDEDRRMPAQRYFPEQGPDVNPVDPETMALIAGLADSASTYKFLKNKTGSETNPALSFANNSPIAVTAAGLGSLGAMTLGRKLLRKKYPKVADMWATGQGAEQIGLAASNMNLKKRAPGTRGANSFENYNMTLRRGMSRE